MSGGIAYVLDDGRLEAHCNRELVELEGLDADDEQTVRDLVAEHARRTGSRTAEELLEDWAGARTRFVKVISPAYRDALAEDTEHEPDEERVAA